jgi:hypothetical protein
MRVIAMQPPHYESRRVRWNAETDLYETPVIVLRDGMPMEDLLWWLHYGQGHPMLTRLG